VRRRWNWDFEDEQRPPRAPPPPPPAPPAPPTPPPSDVAHVQARFRLRRGAAAAIVVLLLALVIALGGSHHRASPHSPAARGGSPAGSPPPSPTNPAGSENQAVLATLAYTPFVREGSRAVRDIALTFDDGPGPYTPQVLSVLEQAHVPATFFAIGKMERYFSASTIRELRDGDVVGDHTETHPMLARLSAREQHEQLFEQIVRIELLGGPRPHLFRPPYGSFNAATLSELRALKLLMVLWSADTGDYAQPGVPVIVQRALAGAHPGAIILLHDGGGDRTQTIAALPQIIHELRARGYHLVTVPQLLHDDPPPAGLPLPPNLAGD
jgi:peptidoglycan/xylan/chitin deacetylase (PgdA/CDA1 family)